MLRQLVIAHLEFVRSISDKTLAGFPDDKLCHQRSPVDNHPVWVMGHIASTDMWVGAMLGVTGMTMPEGSDKLFGQGSKPSTNPKDYPPVAEIRKAYTQNRAALLAWYRAATDAQLGASLKEKSGGFVSTALDAALVCAWHEGWHFGQVATLRKDLGLPSAFGG